MSGVADGGLQGATDAAEPLVLAGVRLPGGDAPVELDAPGRRAVRTAGRTDRGDPASLEVEVDRLIPAREPGPGEQQRLRRVAALVVAAHAWHDGHQ